RPWARCCADRCGVPTGKVTNARSDNVSFRLPGEHDMARLVAAFGSSHSPMLASSVEEWQTNFLPRDRARQFVDFDGNPCDYTTLLARAPADAPERIAPEQLARRHGEAMA